MGIRQYKNLIFKLIFKLIKTYQATIQILVPAEDETQALDLLSSILTENLMEDKSILDWGYLTINNRQQVPEFVVHNPEKYKEFDWQPEEINTL